MRWSTFFSSTIAPRSIARDSDLVIADSRRLAAIFGDVDLEVGEESRRFHLEKTQRQHCHSTNLELRSLAAAQLEHRAPGARVRRDDDFCLCRIGQNSTRRLSRH